MKNGVPQTLITEYNHSVSYSFDTINGIERDQSCLVNV